MYIPFMGRAFLHYLYPARSKPCFSFALSHTLNEISLTNSEVHISNVDGNTLGFCELGKNNHHIKRTNSKGLIVAQNHDYIDINR